MTRLSFPMASSALSLAACALAGCASTATVKTPVAPAAVANVDLRVSEGPNDDSRRYAARTSITVPPEHSIGDRRFPYEGIGWENELIGHRIYLDERSVADVFGKTGGAVALPQVDYRGKYHALGAWGMDVMHVGPSMGIGGLGLYRGGKLARFGKGPVLSAEVLESGGPRARFRLQHTGVPLDGGALGTVRTSYRMTTGSPVTFISVESDLPANMLATGLVAHPKAETLEAAQPRNGWTYVARWGDWSENGDALGILLFYRLAEAQRMPIENETVPIRFSTASPRYAIAATWAKGQQAITTKADFVRFADKTLNEVAKSAD